MGRFARFAQATYLLDRVLRHIQNDTLSKSAREEEAFQLDKALSALITFTAKETKGRAVHICAQAALCQRLRYIVLPHFIADSPGP